MAQPDTAVLHDAATGVSPLIFAPAGRHPETLRAGFTLARGNETLVWKELTYKGRTFEFNREIHVRVLEEDGGWAFESDDPEIMGFGLTRAEAEFTYCLGFAAQWDDLACEEDDNRLTLDAIEVKHALLALVSLVKVQR
jgi:hypothetical protein